MIEGCDIVCVAPGPWEDIWRNRHQIMSRLARRNRVLYVEPWCYLHPTLKGLRSGQVRWADLGGPILRQVADNLHVYRPAGWAPRASGLPLERITQAVTMRHLRRVLAGLGLSRPILWLFVPDGEVFVGQFGERLVVYHIVDEYSAYSGVSAGWRPIVQKAEAHLAARADLVFVTSESLWEGKRLLNPHTVWVPNAVDYAAFADAAYQRTPPPDVGAIAPPIVGYVGAINDKIDLALLGEAAARGRSWSWVLVGPLSVADAEGQKALEELRSLPNVHLLGRKSVDDVPLYMAACNACLLPYRVNEWTRNIDSLKLYEYLACGKPVLATDVPAARRFSEVVYIVRGANDLLEKLQNALEHDDAALQLRRRHIAAQNTWDQRVEAISAAIGSRLAASMEGATMSAERKD